MKKFLGFMVVILLSCNQSKGTDVSLISGLSQISSSEISLFTKTKVVNLSRESVSQLFSNNSKRLMAQTIRSSAEQITIGTPILVESVVSQQSIIEAVGNDPSIPDDKKLQAMQKAARSTGDYYIISINSGDSVVAQVTVSAVKINEKLPSRYPVMLFDDFLPAYTTAELAKSHVMEKMGLEKSQNVSVKAVSLSLDGDLYTRYSPSWLVSSKIAGKDRDFLVSMGIPSTKTLDLMMTKELNIFPKFGWQK